MKPLTAALGLFSAVSVMLVSMEARANYNEATQGDLSNSNTAPTVIPVNLGSNVITGTTGTADGDQGTAGVDRDYFTITVPTGAVLSAITQTNFSAPEAAAGDVAFFGVQAGTTFTSPTTTAASQLLGYVLFGANSENLNLEPDMAQGIDTATGTATFGAPAGFTPPLPAGTYTFWIQDDNSPTTNYQLNFQLTLSAPVPALPPAFAGLLALGLAAFGATRVRVPCPRGA